MASISTNHLKDPILYHGEPASRDDDCACADYIASTDHLESENDCACASAVPSVASIPAGTLYRREPGLYTAPLAGEYHLALGPASPTGPVVLNAAAWQRLAAFEHPRLLETAVEQEMAHTGLLTPFLATPVPTPRPQQLTAWLHVTNACNLDCPYCYVQKSCEAMSLETGRQALAGIFATAQKRGFRQVKLKYAGGEPTLHFSLVHSLHTIAMQLSRATGIVVHEVILSNGTLIRPAGADWLRQSGVRLMVSLDGIGTDHDCTRSTCAGKGTFSRVEHTIDQVLLPRGIQPTISITVTGLNAGGIAGAVRWSLDRRLPVSINFYRRPHDTTAPQSLALEEERILQGMADAYHTIEAHLHEQPMLNGLLDRFHVGAHQVTCGVGQAYVVIDQRGRLAPCHMLLSAGKEIDPAGGDLVEQAASALVHNLPVDEKTSCRSCRFRYYCTGGCPLETYHATGRWDAPSPNCRIYQKLIPLALRLEGLRLLKSNGIL
ncbi:MAG: SPASM domain-containing protein [Anaerolineaceae bacterium]|nr:SPASM domain-containing protein [Anaerolineaceae bacterium]